MTAIQQSKDILTVAQSLGYDIDDSVTFDSTEAIKKVAAQLNGQGATFGAEDASFGGFFLTKLFKKPQKKIAGKLQAKAQTPAQKQAAAKLADARIKVNVKKSATGLVKVTGKAAAIASFAVPGVGPLVGGTALSAMQAADKLLGDPAVKNASQLVSNTKALAALGDVPARRGAAVLGAVAQMRAAQGAQSGQAVVKPGAVNASAYVQNVPAAKVKKLAVQTLSKKKTFWQKLKDLFT